MKGDIKKHLGWKFFVFVLVVSAFLVFSWGFNNSSNSTKMTGMAATYNFCHDYDGSVAKASDTNNPFGVNTASFAVRGEVSKKDKCLDYSKVNEAFCLSSSEDPYYKSKTCASGTTCLENSEGKGRCVPCSDPDSSPNLLDSGSWDSSIKVPSITRGKLGAGAEITNNKDSCNPEKTKVTEYFCNSNSGYVSPHTKLCPYNFYCETNSIGVGYCKQTPVSLPPVSGTTLTTTTPTTAMACSLSYLGNDKCKDSDATPLVPSLQYYQAGQVCYKSLTGVAKSVEDKCGGIGQPVNQLTEQTCGGLLGAYKAKKILCENGCVDKKCVVGIVSIIDPANLTVVNSQSDAVSFKCGVDSGLGGTGNPKGLEKVLLRTTLSGSWAVTQQKNWLQGNILDALSMRTFTFDYNFTQNPVDDGIYYWKCEGLDSTPIVDKHYFSNTRAIEVNFDNSLPTENTPPEQIDSLVYVETNVPTDIDLNDYFYDAEDDAMIYSFVPSSVTGITITSLSNNELTLTPQLNFVGQRNLSVTVSDGQESVVGKLEIYVDYNLENSPPVIDSFSPSTTSVILNTSQSKVFSVSASDAEEDDLTYSWSQGSLNLSSTTNSLTFVSSALGPTTISVSVSDGINEVSYSWNVQITGSDDEGVCGDGVKDLGEVCDGNNLGGESCTTQGFDSGTLSCSTDCFSFDTSLCRMTPPPAESSCGDGTCNSDETVSSCPEDCSDVNPPSTGYLIWVIVGVLVLLSAVGAVLVWKIQKDKTPSKPITPSGRPPGSPGPINPGFRPISPPPRI